MKIGNRFLGKVRDCLSANIDLIDTASKATRKKGGSIFRSVNSGSWQRAGDLAWLTGMLQVGSKTQPKKED